jgi:hypothetical protein
LLIADCCCSLLRAGAEYRHFQRRLSTSTMHLQQQSAISTKPLYQSATFIKLE